MTAPLRLDLLVARIVVELNLLRHFATNGHRLAVLEAIAQLDDRPVAELLEFYITGRV